MKRKGGLGTENEGDWEFQRRNRCKFESRRNLVSSERDNFLLKKKKKLNSNGIEFFRNYSILSVLFFKNHRKVDCEDTYPRRKDPSFDRKKCIYDAKEIIS